VGEIKSAWEIAQEKANKLGELTAEERKKQRENRCRLIGKTLAEKYISQHDVRLLEAELSKHSGQDKGLISQAVLHRLVEGIDLEYSLKLDEIGQGILSLSKAEASAQIMDKIKELFHEYREAENNERREIERAGREILHQLRISGTAINQINIRAKGEWQKRLNDLARPLEERLSSLKQELLSSVGI